MGQFPHSGPGRDIKFIRNILVKNNPGTTEGQITFVKGVYDYSHWVLLGKRRVSGHEYPTHFRAAGKKVAQWGGDFFEVALAFGHDDAEKGERGKVPLDYKQIASDFSKYARLRPYRARFLESLNALSETRIVDGYKFESDHPYYAVLSNQAKFHTNPGYFFSALKDQQKRMVSAGAPAVIASLGDLWHNLSTPKRLDYNSAINTYLKAKSRIGFLLHLREKHFSALKADERQRKVLENAIGEILPAFRDFEIHLIRSRKLPHPLAGMEVDYYRP